MRKYTSCKKISKRKKDCDLFFKDIVKGASREYHTSSVVMRREYCFNKPDYFKVAKGYGDYPQGIYLTTNAKIRYFADTMSVYRLYSNPTSWSYRTLLNKEKEIQLFENVCTFLETVKSFVEEEKFQYIDEAILEHKIKIAELKGEFGIVKKEPYYSIYKKQTFIYRLKFVIKKNFPWLYKILRK